MSDGATRRLVAGVARVSAEGTRPPLWHGMAAGLLALPFHLVTVGAAGGGVFLVLFGGTTWHRILGVLLLLLAAGTVPRPHRRPRHSARLTSAQAPVLFGLVRSVADDVHAPMPAEILISRDVNALVTRVGWRRRRVLLLGAPLWVASPPQARIALLGHELGHFAHGDLMRSFWVGGALDSGIWWLGVMTPGAISDGYSRIVDVVFFAPWRRVLVSYLELMLLANGPAHRRQEVMADLDGLRVGGSDGAIALMDTLLAEPSISVAMTRSAISAQPTDMWESVRAQVLAVPEIERERRRRAAALDRNRIDDSHPTTAFRMELLKSRPFVVGQVQPDGAAWARVDAELAGAMSNSARHARDAARFDR